ncbi:hypothetical protein KC878_01700 [Candidatus Saccharibacteria bacterium]|nr:hypothetical protein [Candidatus Saccharibacteria bacterium]MCB9821687.1 hypothetical protein [Candidatus Nomurabacteria bacterium]
MSEIEIFPGYPVDQEVLARSGLCPRYYDYIEVVPDSNPVFGGMPFNYGFPGQLGHKVYVFRDIFNFLNDKFVEQGLPSQRTVVDYLGVIAGMTTAIALSHEFSDTAMRLIDNQTLGLKIFTQEDLLRARRALQAAEIEMPVLRDMLDQCLDV